jgi:hypothetical protein
MTASAVTPKSASENQYRILRANFEAAYQEMKAASSDYNAVLIATPLGITAEERRARKDRAAQVYEEAHDRFMTAVRTLHEFLVDQIVASHSAFPPALIQR